MGSTKGYEQESQYKMLEAQEECDKLEQQIVNSPERIRGELRTMEEDLRRCRTEATREEQRTAGIAHRTTEVEKAIKNISKCNAAMDTAIAEMTRYKDAKKELRETQSTIRTGEAELRECEARRNLAQRQIANLEEKLKKTQRMRRTKEAA